MRTMILLSAIPASGKSTWAHRYQMQHPNTKIVASDDIRLELFGSAICFKNEPLVWETFLNRINDYAKENDDVTVIADATNLQNKYRVLYRNSTPDFEKHILVLFDVPFETCLKQNAMRKGERVLPLDAMIKLKNEWEELTPDVASLYDEIIHVKDHI